MKDLSSDNSKMISEIKKDLFRYRNGVLAESLKKIYPNKMIFGLNVPQLMELSNNYPKDKDLALSLWEDNSSREIRLLSLYLLPPNEVDYDTAEKMIMSVENNEQAEHLAFRVLRKLNGAKDVLNTIQQKDLKDPIVEYCVKMFQKNLEFNS